MLSNAFVLIALAFFFLVILCALAIWQSIQIDKQERRIAYYKRAQARRTVAEKPRGNVVKLSEARRGRRSVS